MQHKVFLNILGVIIGIYAQMGYATKENLPYRISDKKCAAENIEVSQSSIRNIVAKRSDITALGLQSDANVIDALVRGMALPCEPGVDTAKAASTWPENVQLVSRILPEGSYKQLINAQIVGKRVEGGVTVTGPEPRSQPTYSDFLGIVARYPFFCGEKGVWSSVEAACKRELATFFAHAAQETGGGETIHQILNWTRESKCWPVKDGKAEENDAASTCVAYDGLCPDGFCPKDVHYYGRGIKQVSWYYNYMGVSGTFLKDHKILVEHPDYVAEDGYLLLASGVWFFMTPQPPKPSMHDVVTGRYKPKAASNNISLDSDGSVLDKFAATVSIVNGGNECSSAGYPGYLVESRNRFSRYLDMLAFLGVTNSEYSVSEASYTSGQTYCSIAQGNAFVAGDLIFNPRIYIDMGSCDAITYESPGALNIVSTPNAYSFCLDNTGK
jgi:basic endochitinase B